MRIPKASRKETVREALQSGWPDSNRRLLAPKASTLTRLSYTPDRPSVEAAQSAGGRAGRVLCAFSTKKTEPLANGYFKRFYQPKISRFDAETAKSFCIERR